MNFEKDNGFAPVASSDKPIVRSPLPLAVAGDKPIFGVRARDGRPIDGPAARSVDEETGLVEAARSIDEKAGEAGRPIDRRADALGGIAPFCEG